MRATGDNKKSEITPPTIVAAEDFCGNYGTTCYIDKHEIVPLVLQKLHKKFSIYNNPLGPTQFKILNHSVYNTKIIEQRTNY
jgi:hypothetical protein